MTVKDERVVPTLVSAVAMTSELKPCPFCGNQPVVFPDDSYGGCGVSCPDCDIIPDQCFLKIGQLDKAIAAWNTRPEAAQVITDLQRERDALRRALIEAVHHIGDVPNRRSVIEEARTALGIGEPPLS